MGIGSGGSVFCLECLGLGVDFTSTGAWDEHIRKG